MVKGSCMCGAVHYEYTGNTKICWISQQEEVAKPTQSGEPEATALCHCTDCQKWSGGAYTANIVVPRKTFKTTQGSPKSYTVIGDSGGKNVHWFCSDCGSSLYTELEVMPDSTCIKSGTIDDKDVREGKIGVEFYTKDRVAYIGAVEGAEQKRVFLDS
ncbi:MAG: hypothetical protein Q9195_007578 [Heterodermia aff. obscurata]